MYVRRGAISTRLLSYAKEVRRRSGLGTGFRGLWRGNAKRERKLESLLPEVLAGYVQSLKGMLSRKLQVAAPNGEVMNVALRRV